MIPQREYIVSLVVAHDECGAVVVVVVVVGHSTRSRRDSARTANAGNTAKNSTSATRRHRGRACMRRSHCALLQYWIRRSWTYWNSLAFFFIITLDILGIARDFWAQILAQKLLDTFPACLFNTDRTTAASIQRCHEAHNTPQHTHSQGNYRGITALTVSLRFFKKAKSFAVAVTMVLCTRGVWTAHSSICESRTHTTAISQPFSIHCQVSLLSLSLYVHAHRIIFSLSLSLSLSWW